MLTTELWITHTFAIPLKVIRLGANFLEDFGNWWIP